MAGTKKSKQRLKRHWKDIATRQAAENRQTWKFKSNSKQQPAPKPDVRTLQQQLEEAREHAASANAQVAALQQQQQQKHLTHSCSSSCQGRRSTLLMRQSNHASPRSGTTMAS